ncbi:MAG: DUF3696 domain-containing protein [Nitrospira sp.]
MINVLGMHNFKCFEAQTLKLGPLTLLSGLNGMGKSTVLQSLLLLRQSHEQHLLPDTGLALNGELVNIGTAADALFEGASEDKIGFDVGLSDGTVGRWRFKYDKEADVIEVDTVEAPDGIFSSSLFGDYFQYLNAERLGPRTSFPISDYQVRHHRQLGTKGEYTAHFLSLFGRNEISVPGLAHEESESLQLRDQVEAWIGEMSPGVRVHFVSHEGMDLVNLQYSFLQGDQISNQYRSTNVGFGITYVLPTVVAILSSKPGTLLLLENPEAHLHPKGQAKLGELMARAAAGEVQIIVETHSDHVLNGIRIAVKREIIQPSSVNLHFFTQSLDAGKIQKTVISPDIRKDGRLAEWPGGFFDEWDKSLEVLLS